MPDTLDILRKLALQIRNASSEGENTAERVGRTFIGILELIQQGMSIEELSKVFLRKDQADGTPLPHNLRRLGQVRRVYHRYFRRLYR